MKTREQILEKYQGQKLAAHPCKLLLLGYKSLHKPFKLRPTRNLNLLINQRAYVNRITKLMDKTIEQFKKQHSHE